MFTTVGFLEDIDPAAAFVNIAALADQHVSIAGDDIRVPELNNIVAVAGLVDTVVAGQARLVSPTLRRKSNLYLAPLNGQSDAAQEPDSPQKVIDMRSRPIALITGEDLTCQILSNPAAAQDQSVIVWLADGPITPVDGAIFTTRVTGTATLTVNIWHNAAITFAENLPRGRYQIVGMRAESAGLVAARVVFVGGTGWRPGVLGCDLVGDLQSEIFRNGNFGVFGEFEDTDPPTIDFLSVVADTAEVLYLDLIQVREGPG